MGMDAEIICVGRFDPSIVDCLSYSPEDYEGTPKGYPVVATAMHCNTSSASKELAEALGVDPGDFGTHQINPDNIDLLLLEELSERMVEWEEEEIDHLQRLIEAGFICIYCPNY